MSKHHTKKDAVIHLLVNRQDIAMLNKIMEAYSHLGVVSTVDREKGLLVIRATSDTAEEVRMIIERLPFAVEALEDSL